MFQFTLEGFPGHLLNVVIVLMVSKLYTSVTEQAKLGGAFVLGLEDL